MKKYFLICMFLIQFAGVKAQVDMGKIAVCGQYTVTLLFSTDIDFVIFGNNPMLDIIDDMPEYENYAIFQKGKTLILKANKDNIPPTSINIKTMDGVLWYGFIENKDNSTLFYDFTKKVPASSQAASTQSAQTAVSDTGNPVEPLSDSNKNGDFEKKLDHVMKQSLEYRKFGLISGKLTFMVPNIMNDTENMYVKIVIQNQSGNAFEINSVVFKHVEGKTKGVKKNQVQNEERLMPVFEKTVSMIEAYSKHELGYVLPLFSTGEDGRFIIQFVENKGTRNYQIELSAKDMQKIKVFNL
ncbi:MAG: DUF4138 domain-containing protein [Tannerella sp.]|nr:DUF4138 domain-containing protein [Tannerella sp.]